ncbi:MAG: hypothetical protein WCK89_23035 [bacterium]
MSEIREHEESVKSLIRGSLQKRLEGKGRLDPDLLNKDLAERWLTDIMFIGFNNDDLEAAAKDIYEIQKPLEGLTTPLVLMEDIRGRVFWSSNRFFDEIEAFKAYMELRKTASGEILIHEVKKALSLVEPGSLMEL